ncbi:MAG TPA: glycine cleavage T C-terminal barrel domain-containing protein [Pyrinomonadaceae bacterium]|nr:glycine cleavage T C-terminal barrel domain-containing protein [Pyrinomonadaceae bacterium]
MSRDFWKDYRTIRSDGGIGFREPERGLIEVSGKEAAQFLNGLLTNDVAKLESYRWMLAAFPNAQGRLLALVRVMRFGERFLFETDAATHQKVFQNLFRFTFAGDFFVRDLSEEFSLVSIRGKEISGFKFNVPVENLIAKLGSDDGDGFVAGAFRADGCDVFLPPAAKENFLNELKKMNAVEISPELHEVLRIENGLPLYGVDMDETTVVLETGLDEAVSFTKGCYIGQEIIARIHFRGHVAKKLTGLIFAEQDAAINPGDEIKSPEGKNAGRVTSVTYSPQLEKTIALAYVRYDFLAEETELKVNDSSASARVKDLPFIA